jgi:pilus assembly protein CpaB
VAKGKDLVIPVLEDVLVLATDHASARPNEDEYRTYTPQDRQRAYNTLTLEVTPKEASLLSIAEGTGMIIATLRNPEDTDGTLFGEVTTADLLHNSKELLLSTISKRYNRNLNGVHYDDKGRLVTRDGVPLKDQSLRLTKDGLLVTKDGKVLSGRDLIVGPDGAIRTKNGDVVDTTNLVAGKGGTLVDKEGTVLSSNGYHALKGGFLQDKDGNVLTPDGHILTGVTVEKDGTVRTLDGKVLHAADLSVDKDGKVHLHAAGEKDMHLDKDGQVVDQNGKVVKAADLVTVDKDGTVRTKDGKVLEGVYRDKNGVLRTKDGKPLTAADILEQDPQAAGLAGGKALHQNDKGQVVDQSGNVVQAADMVTVDKDGTVRTKDGKVLDGVYRDKDGVLRTKDGKPLTAADILKKDPEAAVPAGDRGEVLAGVTAKAAPDFVASIMGKQEAEDEGPASRLVRYEVEYIVGGASKDGTANTFRVLVDESQQPVLPGPQSKQ